jgi:hypothetical protein
MAASGPVLCSAYQTTLLSNGPRNLVCDQGTETTKSYAIRDDLTVVELAQTGAAPDWGSSGDPVFGPAGLIVTDDSGNTYVGVPIAG